MLDHRAEPDELPARSPDPSRFAMPETQDPENSAQPRRRERTAKPHVGRSRLARLWYEATRLGVLYYCSLRGGIRVTGRGNLPRSGGGLIVSNHLSHLDVFVLGLGSPRPLSYVARSSLFKPVLGPLIRSVGGFPIEREGVGVSGLKETLRRLRGGELVLIFPEGTRSPNGELGPLKPGIAALVRAGVPFIPTAVAGTYEAMPRNQLLPRSHPIHVHYGPPIAPQDVAGLSPDELTARLRAGLLDAQQVARCRLARVLREP